MDTDTRSVTKSSAPRHVRPQPGEVLLKEGLAHEALPYLLEAQEREPNEWRHLSNLGVAYRILGDFDTAKSCLKRALDLDKSACEVWSNFGVLLDDLGDFDRSAKAYQAAFQINPHSQTIAFNYSVSLLRQGLWPQAWMFWEFGRFNRSYFAAPNLPQWSGESLDGKTIGVVAEGGYGDIINFLPYIEMVKERARVSRRIVWDDMIPFLEAQGVAHEYYGISRPERVPDIDFVVSVLSIPAILNERVENVRPVIPYVKVDPCLVNTANAMLPPGRNVGICWGAEEARQPRKWRSVPESALAPLVSMKDMNWISLQFGSKSLPWMFDCSESLQGWLKTAALIQNLDLIISVDTAVAHLAGALGKPVWLLLSANSDWRWLRDRKDSIWYPTMRIFRQRDPKDWSSVIAEVTEALNVTA